MWPPPAARSGLRDLIQPQATPASAAPALSRRLLLAQYAWVARCFDDYVLRNNRDAEVGAIFGIGFAPNTGGPLAWMDRQGIPALVAELQVLSSQYGERFAPAKKLVGMAERGERFFG